MSQPRPSLHFSPQRGWINDPNGLIRLDGVYHLFYQFNPDNLVHSPMHWGHARSRDLVTWEELPVALYPDATGQCFSGSAVAVAAGMVAPEFADAGALLFYTAHQNRPDRSYLEEQHIALADREMNVFRKFAGNPVVPNPGPHDFRDPKVIWHEPTRRWIMVVTVGQAIGIFSSPDAKDWRFESEFGRNEGRHSQGPWECPDLFPIASPDGGAPVWILLVGIGSGHISGGSGTQYFVGDFDGRTFTNRNSATTELFLDLGRDFYAAQTFSGMEGDGPLVMAWMSNWAYANHTPATEFRGSMTLPRQLRLIETFDGLRLKQQIPHDVAVQFPEYRLRPGEDLSPGSGTYRLSGSWTMTGGQKLDLCLFGESLPVLSLTRKQNGSTTTLHVIRQDRGDINGGGHFGVDYAFDVPNDLPVDFEVFVDNGLVEISSFGGRFWMSNSYFPSDPHGNATLTLLQIS